MPAPNHHQQGKAATMWTRRDSPPFKAQSSVVTARIGEIHRTIRRKMGNMMIDDKQRTGIGNNRNMQSRLRIAVPRIAVVYGLGKHPHPPDGKAFVQFLIRLFKISAAKSGNKFAKSALIHRLLTRATSS